jgi:hypothetical protein
MKVPPHAMALGIPATIREGTVREGQFDRAVDLYERNGRRYRAELTRMD